MCPGGKDNLIPAKPGEVRNPEGRNQYTYRRDAEKHLDEWCRKYGQELIERLLEDAKSGKGWAMKLALDRILPAVQHHDVALTDPVTDAGLMDRLAAIARARKANGHDTEAETSGEGTPQ